MRRTLAQKKAVLTCGYSLAEIIVSMALIAMLSAAGFAVCYTAVNLQGKSERNLRIWNAADAVRGSFAAAVYAAGVSDDPQDKLAAGGRFSPPAGVCPRGAGRRSWTALPVRMR